MLFGPRSTNQSEQTSRHVCTYCIFPWWPQVESHSPFHLHISPRICCHKLAADSMAQCHKPHTAQKLVALSKWATPRTKGSIADLSTLLPPSPFWSGGHRGRVRLISLTILTIMCTIFSISSLNLHTPSLALARGRFGLWLRRLLDRPAGPSRIE